MGLLHLVPLLIFVDIGGALQPQDTFSESMKSIRAGE